MHELRLLTVLASRAPRQNPTAGGLGHGSGFLIDQGPGRLWLCLHHSRVKTIPHETSDLLPFLPSTEWADGIGDVSGPRA